MEEALHEPEARYQYLFECASAGEDLSGADQSPTDRR